MSIIRTRINNACDVLILGAGPTGCSAAALQAEQGHRVLVLEREKFPRYHIGESLIPFTFHQQLMLLLIKLYLQIILMTILACL